MQTSGQTDIRTEKLPETFGSGGLKTITVKKYIYVFFKVLIDGNLYSIDIKMTVQHVLHLLQCVPTKPS